MVGRKGGGTTGRSTGARMVEGGTVGGASGEERSRGGGGGVVRLIDSFGSRAEAADPPRAPPRLFHGLRLRGRRGTSCRFFRSSGGGGGPPRAHYRVRSVMQKVPILEADQGFRSICPGVDHVRTTRCGTRRWSFFETRLFSLFRSCLLGTIKFLPLSLPIPSSSSSVVEEVSLSVSEGGDSGSRRGGPRSIILFGGREGRVLLV